MTSTPADGTERFARYAAAKATLTDALGGYLTAVVALGGDDAATSLELARTMLTRDLNAAIDEHVLTVPLTDVWAQLVQAQDRAGRRADRG